MSSPSIPFPWKGNARRARGWPHKAWEVMIESQRFILVVLSEKLSQPLALRATSFQRKEGEIEVSASLYILQV